MSLFEAALDENLLPLAERLRPKSVSEIIGQKHILGDNNPLGKLLKAGHLSNLIITGPPGTGKTSFARALAHTGNSHFQALNAIDAGVKDLKSVGDEGRRGLLERSQKTLLFVDEIHRFNKSQQDVLLPYIERGDIYLIGATTEHPSYELNKALLSRCRVIEFKRLDYNDFESLKKRVENFLNFSLMQILEPVALNWAIDMADGDGRRFLNILESVMVIHKIDPQDQFPLNLERLQLLVGNKIISYDKKSDQHYDCISAFIKSIRGSDPDAALYYMARMLLGGEDPVFIARRLVVLASEDVGNAEPRALGIALSGLQSVEAIGMPECAINLSQVVCYLASCPKSNKSYEAWNKAKEFALKHGSVEIPKFLRSTQKGNDEYKYPHSFEKAYIKQNYWPESISAQIFYEPSQRGQEKNINEYLKWLKSDSNLK